MKAQNVFIFNYYILSRSTIDSYYSLFIRRMLRERSQVGYRQDEIPIEITWDNFCSVAAIKKKKNYGDHRRTRTISLTQTVVAAP